MRKSGVECLWKP